MKSFWRVFIFVVIMGTASSVSLVSIETFTSPLIARNEELKIKSAALDVLEIPYDKTNAIAAFGEKIKTLQIGKDTFYISAAGTTAFEFRGPGLWGPIHGIASISPDLKTIRTIKILHQEETPGLGARIAEAAFLKQFRGKEFFPKLLFVAQGKSSAKNEVDAITGATGSSRALEKLLNETLQKNAAMLKQVR